MKNLSRISFLNTIAALLLSACAGQGGEGAGVATRYVLGASSGGSFVPGLVSVSSNPGSLTSGGTATITVTIIDTDNANSPVSATTPVSFTSGCVAAGTATMGTSVSTNGGVATTTYTAKDGCTGIDTIVATATVDGESLTASGTVTVLQSPVADMDFVSVSQTSIALKGTGSGLPESAIVTFKVLGANGAPAPGVDVTFGVDTSIGGITFTPATVTTNSSGLATTTVLAGSVPTTVRVNATTGLPGVPDAQSTGIVISSGVPDQGGMSISSSCPNIEGATIDGEQTDITVRLSDRFNTPVPNGTAVNFSTEGGTIQSQCTISSGTCSVNLTSQAPRSATHRYTVLATTLGAENFTDNNGNGSYDSGEPFTDLAEAFLDKDEDGTYDVGETFIDKDGNASFTDVSGDYTGPLCNSDCDTTKSVTVRGSLIVVLSSSNADISVNPSSINLSSGPVTVTVSVADSAGEAMAGGTTVSASTSVGTITTPPSYTQSCTTFPGAVDYQFTVTPPASLSSTQSGTFAVTVTSPSGVVSTATAVVTASPGSSGGPAPSSTLGSISFVSASPTEIGLKGSGLAETSLVTFQVTSDTGSVLANQPVSFSLSTSTGGIALSSATGVTDSSGRVSTTVQSGSVHTSVKVLATATQGAITRSTQSGQLTISTTVPSQNGMSLSTERLNMEGHSYDGDVTAVTARLSDRYSNPVPDGTAISFTAESGTITPSCTTVSGECTVTFTTSGARTSTLAQNSAVEATNDCSTTPNGLGCDDHRYTIVATAIGEESFLDTNGNGAYDNSEPFTNLPEAFLDSNESGAFDSACEVPSDFNHNGVWDLGSETGGTPTFTGLICNSSNCDSASTLHVRDSLVIVWSGSVAKVVTTPASLTLAADAQQAVQVAVSDLAGQSLAAGATISAEVISDTAATAGTIVGQNNFTQGDTNFNGPTVYTFTVQRASGTPPAGDLKITVTSSKGVVTTKLVPLN